MASLTNIRPGLNGRCVNLWGTHLNVSHRVAHEGGSLLPHTRWRSAAPVKAHHTLLPADLLFHEAELLSVIATPPAPTSTDHPVRTSYRTFHCCPPVTAVDVPQNKREATAANASSLSNHINLQEGK